jgi:hypothetical protein
MQHASSAEAQTPCLHQVARVWCVPFGQGQQTGVQSIGSEHDPPVGVIRQSSAPTTDAHVSSTFSLRLSTECG